MSAEVRDGEKMEWGGESERGGGGCYRPCMHRRRSVVLYIGEDKRRFPFSGDATMRLVANFVYSRKVFAALSLLIML